MFTVNIFDESLLYSGRKKKMESQIVKLHLDATLCDCRWFTLKTVVRTKSN